MQFRKIQWFVLMTMLIHLLGSLIQPLFVDSIFVQVYLGQMVFLAFGLAFLWRYRKNAVTFSRLQLPPWWSFVLVIPVMLATIYLSNFVTMASMLFTRSIGLIDIPAQEFTNLTSNNLLLVLTFSLLPGIVEEFYCRGVLLPAYDETLSTRKAILYSALMFGLMHFNLWNILSPIVLGVVFSLLTLRFQSIIPAMFGHALFNLLVLGAQKFQMSSEFDIPETVVSGNELVKMIPSTAMALLFLVWIFYRLGVRQYFKPAQVKLRPLDHLPTALIISLFVGIVFLIQKGLGL